MKVLALFFGKLKDGSITTASSVIASSLLVSSLVISSFVVSSLASSVGGGWFVKGKTEEDVLDFFLDGYCDALKDALIREFSLLITAAVTFFFLWETPRVLLIDFIRDSGDDY